jgi:hypothetical protein
MPIWHKHTSRNLGHGQYLSEGGSCRTDKNLGHAHSGLDGRTHILSVGLVMREGSSAILDAPCVFIHRCSLKPKSADLALMSRNA